LDPVNEHLIGLRIEFNVNIYPMFAGADEGEGVRLRYKAWQTLGPPLYLAMTDEVAQPTDYLSCPNGLTGGIIERLADSCKGLFVGSGRQEVAKRFAIIRDCGEWLVQLMR